VYDINFHGINNTNASLNHTEKHRNLLEKMSNNKFLEQDIETKTYSQLILELNINKLDLFVLDVEGHEFEVLEGMVGCNVLPDVFVIEHGHREVGVFDKYLSKLNAQYKLDFVSHVNSFYVKIT
jgi:FkbM family methyltransferase